MLLSERLYCLAVTFKMTEWVEQQIFFTFLIKLQHSSLETIQMIQKVVAMGNWWLAASSQQCACSSITHLLQSFGAKHQITQVTQPHYSPDLAPCDFWLFSKLKSPSKRKRFQTVSEIQENTMGQLMAIGRTVSSQGVYTEGGWGFIVLCTMFIVSCVFFLCFHVIWKINVYFSYHMCG